MSQENISSGIWKDLGHQCVRCGKVVADNDGHEEWDGFACYGCVE